MDEQNRESSLEWLKFGTLMVVMLGAIGVVWLAGPAIFDRVVPAFLGEPAATPGPPEELFIPATAADEAEIVPPALEEEDAYPPAAAEDTADPTPAPAAAADSPPPAEPATATHVVQPGETLTSIAAAYNITVEDLLAANSLANPNRIMPGDELVVPTRP